MLIFIKNKLYANSSRSTTTANYLHVDLGASLTPKKMSSKIVWTKGLKDVGQSVAMISNPGGMTLTAILANSLHIVFTPTYMQADLLIGGSFTNLGSHTYDKALECDGNTEYQISWEVDGDTITITSPDGYVSEFTNVGIPGTIGRYCTFEHYWTDPLSARPLFTYLKNNK